MADNSKSHMWRVTGLPGDKAADEVETTLRERTGELLIENEKQDLKVKIYCVPSCDESNTLNALVEFEGYDPKFLSQVSPQKEWQVEMGEHDISFDRHFFGFTQLFPTDLKFPVNADIVALHGLGGHAYCSWRGEGNLRRMWLRDFLSKELPRCRIMTYGYNSKLSVNGLDKLLDYGRGFLEAIKRTRHTKELQERPLILMAHSYGGIILAHCLVKAVQSDARDHSETAALYKATYGIVFFGTPHLGLLIEDMKSMVNDEHNPRNMLLEQIKYKSDLLVNQSEDFKNLIRDRKIISFYERKQTRRLQWNPTLEEWKRTGDYITAVDSDSALLQLPDSIETKIPVDTDHTTMIKFYSRNNQCYNDTLRYLKQFEKDAWTVIKDRFTSIQPRKLPASTVPFDRDKNFVGREAALEAIESILSQPELHNRAVIVGLGGVGKSQIAIEYSYRVRAKYPETWIFWIHAGSASRLKEGYSHIAATLALPGWDDRQTDAMELVLRWLSDTTNGRWLLILDNADDINVFRSWDQNELNSEESHSSIHLARYFPQKETGSVLLTTRDKEIAFWLAKGLESIVTIEQMTSHEAVHLLQTRLSTNKSPVADLKELVGELDYIPLAITQAGSYISVGAPRMTVSKYLAFYRENESTQTRLLDAEAGDLRRDPEVPNSVIRTLQITFDQIKAQNEDAADLFSIMAVLDRQDIPEALLYKDKQDLAFEESLVSLLNFSLVTVKTGGKSFGMHRLVQIAARKWLHLHSEMEKWQMEALLFLLRRIAEDFSESAIPFEALLPHAEQLLRFNVKSADQALALATLLRHLSSYEVIIGNTHAALKYSEDFLSLYQRISDEDSPVILAGAAEVACYLSLLGRSSEAELYLQRAITGTEKLCGLADLKASERMKYVLTLLLALQEILRSGDIPKLASNFFRKITSDYEISLSFERIYAQVLSIKEETHGQGISKTLHIMERLLYVLELRGKYAEAEPLARRVMLTTEKINGPGDLATLDSISTLVAVLIPQEKYTEAEALARRVMIARQRMHGPDNIETLKSCETLAEVLGFQKKYAEAESLAHQTLLIRERIDGPDDSDTLISMSILVRVLRLQKKYTEAEDLARRVMVTRQRIDGPDDLEALKSCENLSELLFLQGRFGEAGEILRQVISARERMTESDIYETWRSYRYLARISKELDEYDKSIELYERAYTGFL